MLFLVNKGFLKSQTVQLKSRIDVVKVLLPLEIFCKGQVSLLG